MIFKDDIIKAHGNIISGRFTNGYIALVGSYLESVVNSYLTKYKLKIPVSYISNQVKRDSNEHHVTVILPNELDKIIDYFVPSAVHSVPTKANKKGHHAPVQNSREDIITAIQLFLDAMEKEVICDWNHLGLGFAQHANEEAYFVVIQWNSFNSFRERLGLPPRDLHVTLGFKKNDIHNETIRKDASSLVLDFSKLDLDANGEDDENGKSDINELE